MRDNFYSGKIVLITGASSGIGKSLARQLHVKNAKVILVARRAELLHALSNELNTKRQGSAESITCDLTNQDQLKNLLEKIRPLEIDYLISNAGFGTFGEFDQIELTREEEMLRLNVLTPMQLMHALIPKFKLKKSGGIIVVSSIAGRQPVPYMSNYAATKAFELFHARGLEPELRPYGVRVLVVCPGPVETGFSGVARVKLASGPRVHPDLVAKEILQAFEAGKTVLYPHWSAKLLNILISISPRIVADKVMSYAMKGIFQEQGRKQS